jgi:hypothetical protein
MQTTTQEFVVALLCLLPTAILRAQDSNPPTLPPGPAEVYRADMKVIRELEQEREVESERSAARWWWFRRIFFIGVVPTAGVIGYLLRKAPRAQSNQPDGRVS